MLKSDSVFSDSDVEKKVRIVDFGELFREKYGVLPVVASKDYILNEVFRRDDRFAVIHPDSALSDFLGKEIPNVLDLLKYEDKDVFNSGAPIYSESNLDQLVDEEDEFEDNFEVNLETSKFIDLNEHSDRESSQKIVYLEPDDLIARMSASIYNNSIRNRYSPNNYIGLRGLEYRAFLNQPTLPRSSRSKYIYNIASRKFECEYKRAS